MCSLFTRLYCEVYTTNSYGDKLKAKLNNSKSGNQQLVVFVKRFMHCKDKPPQEKKKKCAAGVVKI